MSKVTFIKNALKNVTCFTRWWLIKFTILDFFCLVRRHHIKSTLIYALFLTSNTILKALIFPSSELSGSAFLMRKGWFKSVYLRHDISGAPLWDEKEAHERRERPQGIKGFPQQQAAHPIHPTAGSFQTPLESHLAFMSFKAVTNVPSIVKAGNLTERGAYKSAFQKGLPL